MADDPTKPSGSNPEDVMPESSGKGGTAPFDDGGSLTQEMLDALLAAEHDDAVLHQMGEAAAGGLDDVIVPGMGNSDSIDDRVHERLTYSGHIQQPMSVAHIPEDAADLSSAYGKSTELTPLSEDDLAALRAAEAGETLSASFADGPGEFTQDALDDLIASQLSSMAEQSAPPIQSVETPVSTSGGSASLDQGALDDLISLINEVENPVPSASSLIDNGELLLNQEQLDAMLAIQEERSHQPRPVEPLSSEPLPEQEKIELSQDDLDALFAAEGLDATPVKEAGGLMSQAELDTLLNSLPDGGARRPESTIHIPPPRNPPSPPGSDTGALNQSDLDALLGDLTGGAPKDQAPAPAAPAPSGGGALSQSDLDALLGDLTGSAPKSQAPAPAAPAPSGGGALSQSDLDALLGDLTGGAPKSQAPAPAAPAQSGGGALSQSDLDALLGDLTGGAPKGQAPAPAAPAPSGGGALSQSDLDALLGDLTGGVPKSQAPAPAAPASPGGGALSQSDLDALLGDLTGGAPKSQAPASAAPASPGGGLSQSDLDALLGSLTGDSSSTPPSSGAGSLDQGNIDALLAGLDSEKPLVNADMDSPVVGSGAPAMAADQNDIDSLLASLGVDPAGLTPTEPPKGMAVATLGTPAAPESDAGSISQDMINALLADAGISDEPVISPDFLRPNPVPNMPAPPPPSPHMESGSMLEAVSPHEAEASVEVEEAPLLPQARPQKSNFIKALMLAAALVLVTLGTVTYFVLGHSAPEDAAQQTAQVPAAHEEPKPEPVHEAPPPEEPAKEGAPPAEEAHPAPEAHPAQEVAKVVAPDAEADAKFEKVEAAFKTLLSTAPAAAIEEMQLGIDRFSEEYPSYARLPEAWEWKAQLYRWQGIPLAARDFYRRILNAMTPESEGRDRVLLELGKLSTEINQYAETEAYARQLLKEHPKSTLLDDARLLMADSAAGKGNTRSAINQYLRIAQTPLSPRTGALAIERLGRFAFDKHEFDEAITQLERRLAMATTVEGNDSIYLLLAKAYRAKGRLEDSRRTLNELISFFPDTPVMPDAFIELSQVLEELGLREDAVQMATVGARRYKENAAVLKNQAAFLEKADEKRAAGSALLGAYKASPTPDPALLLQAARNFRAGAAYNQAIETYDALLKGFPQWQEALDASIERGETLYQNGDVGRSIAVLERMARQVEGTPKHLPILTYLGGIYNDLGLKERAGEVFREVATLTTEPEVLAKAAVSLFEAGMSTDAFAAANNVDLNKITEGSAYELLMKYGDGLRQVEPLKALNAYEKAWQSYPKYRTPDGDSKLLDAYLATDQMARARALVMEINTVARQNPGESARFQESASRWADALYAKRDHRAALDAYAMISALGAPDTEHSQWARYQEANCLLQMADYETAAKAFDIISQSSSSWAAEAAVKSSYARLEQQVRGLPVTPVGVEDESQKQGQQANAARPGATG